MMEQDFDSLLAALARCTQEESLETKARTMSLLLALRDIQSSDSAWNSYNLLSKEDYRAKVLQESQRWFDEVAKPLLIDKTASLPGRDEESPAPATDPLDNLFSRFDEFPENLPEKTFPEEKTDGLALVCVECGEVFVLKKDHADWYARRGWHLPKRCPDCLAKSKEKKGGSAHE